MSFKRLVMASAAAAFPKRLCAASRITRSLGYDCSPNAALTLQLMREQAPDQAAKDGIDAKIKLAEPQRQEKCDASTNQSK
jgi:hypothetical protein